MNQISLAQRFLFTVVTILYWTSMYVYVPTLSPYLSNQGFSLSFIGIVLGSYGLVQMFIRFPLGILSDKLGTRKPFILLGMATAAISCLLFLIPGLWVWPLAGRLMAGVCASTWVAFTVLYASYFGAGQTGKAMGNISVMTVSGQMIGMLLSGWLTEDFSADAPFTLGAVIAVIGLLLALLLKEPQRGGCCRFPCCRCWPMASCLLRCSASRR
jgi:MFS family permease